jgi:alpha-L-arabinofuranosidase
VETPESCALFAEYCFGGADTKGGRMRIANGRTEPYKPFFVEIGNEQHGNYLPVVLLLLEGLYSPTVFCWLVFTVNGALEYGIWWW